MQSYTSLLIISGMSKDSKDSFYFVNQLRWCYFYNYLNDRRYVALMSEDIFFYVFPMSKNDKMFKANIMSTALENEMETV